MQSSAPLYYFFCLHFTKNFIINFVVTTVLIVVEFWYTKNIVGRRLTGMRWWQVPSPDSTKTTWRFEHRTLEQVRIRPVPCPTAHAAFQHTTHPPPQLELTTFASTPRA